MATVAEVRALLGDLPRAGSYSATGNGSTKLYAITSCCVVDGSQAVTVNGTPKSEGTDYTIDNDLGLVTFVTPPTNGHAIVVTFSYTELSDATITALLAIESSAYLAAAAGARAISAKYASAVDRQVGDLRIQYSQRAKAWADLAKSITAAAGRSVSAIVAPWAGGISKSDKETYRRNPDLTQPAFTRDLHEFPAGSENPSDI